MIDFRKLGEFCARHGCAEKYLRNVESEKINGFWANMPKGNNSQAIYGAFFWPESEFEYWSAINKLWMQELKE